MAFLHNDHRAKLSVLTAGKWNGGEKAEVRSID